MIRCAVPTDASTCTALTRTVRAAVFRRACSRTWARIMKVRHSICNAPLVRGHLRQSQRVRHLVGLTARPTGATQRTNCAGGQNGVSTAGRFRTRVKSFCASSRCPARA